MILRKLSELFKPSRRRRLKHRRVRPLRHRRFSNVRAQLQDAREGRRVRLKPLPIGVLAQQQRMNRILDWLDLDLMSQPFQVW